MKTAWMVVGAAGALGAGLWVANGCRASARYEVGASEQAGSSTTDPATAGVATAAAAPRQGWTTAVEPKPQTEAVRRGLDWLVQHQEDDGGWAQGEEVARLHGSDAEQRDRSNVADTCIAALALVRAGSTPAGGPHAKPLERAVAFVCGEVEAADAESLYVTSVRGTRVQSKIGTFVDTFLASMLLSEVKGRSGVAADERVDAALAKVLDKISRNQNQSGGWDGQGWAPILSQSLGGKGLNRAAQAGASFDLGVLEKLEGLTAAGPGDAVPSSAGVQLYAVAGTSGNAQDFVNSGFVRERALRDKLAETTDSAERERIEDELEELGTARDSFEKQQGAFVGRLDDPSFVSGFGSNGGEEFLSYMNISESLVVRADDVWRRWDAAMGQNLGRVQNDDGSWTGHHCITGRTFCTASALLVLLADRSPVPVEVLAARR